MVRQHSNNATGCLCSLPGSAAESYLQGPTRKQVHFDLTKDMNDTPPLPADFAHFLGGATDEQIDAPQYYGQEYPNG